MSAAPAEALEAARTEEAQRLLTLLLEQRFGFLSPQVYRRLEAPREQLEAWVLRLAAATTVQDVLGEL